HRSALRRRPVSALWSRSDTLTGHRGDVSEAEIDPASELLITIGWGDRMIIWNASREVADVTRLDPTRWLRIVCAVVDRDLSPAEWSRYLPGRPWQATCSDQN